MTLRIIDTFSGIGGFSLAARWLGGFQTVQFVEWQPYCHLNLLPRSGNS